jgi:hypothetical protein
MLLNIALTIERVSNRKNYLCASPNWEHVVLLLSILALRFTLITLDILYTSNCKHASLPNIPYVHVRTCARRRYLRKEVQRSRRQRLIRCASLYSHRLGNIPDRWQILQPMINMRFLFVTSLINLIELESYIFLEICLSFRFFYSAHKVDLSSIFNILSFIHYL